MNRRASGKTLPLALLLLIALLGGSRMAHAGTRLTGDEALALAFPGCTLERKTIFLSDDQKKAAAQKSGEKIESALVHAYRATCAGKPGGAAYFDVHRVRTLPERLLIAVDPTGKVLRIEVLTFDEPPQYLPRAGWYGLFLGKGLEDGIDLGKAIRPIAGATLTAKATAAAVRRVLALHQVITEASP